MPMTASIDVGPMPHAAHAPPPSSTTTSRTDRCVVDVEQHALRALEHDVLLGAIASRRSARRRG